MSSESEIRAIVAPTDAGTGGTFESLREAVARHVGAGASQPKGHRDLVAVITQRHEDATSAIASLQGPAVALPAERELREKRLRLAHKVAAAHGELLAALTRACGDKCAPGE